MHVKLFLFILCMLLWFSYRSKQRPYRVQTWRQRPRPEWCRWLSGCGIHQRRSSWQCRRWPRSQPLSGETQHPVMDGRHSAPTLLIRSLYAAWRHSRHMRCPLRAQASQTSQGCESITNVRCAVFMFSHMQTHMLCRNLLRVCWFPALPSRRYPPPITPTPLPLRLSQFQDDTFPPDHSQPAGKQSFHVRPSLWS